MTENSSGSSDQGRSDDWNRGGYLPGEQYTGEQYYGAGSAGSSRPGSAGRGYGSGQGGSGYESGQGSSGYGPGRGSGYESGSGSSYESGSGSSYGPGQVGAGYGSGGAGAARPAPGPPRTAGSAGPSPATAPIWQVAPGHGPGSRGQAGFETDAAPSAGAQAMNPPPLGTSRGADGRSFLGALFDFSFTSFVTTKIIKVLYVLILVLASITALIYTIVAFRLSAAFGLLTLVIGDPLFIIIVMALWRLILESFIVRFRIAEDVRALRERSGTSPGRQAPLP